MVWSKAFRFLFLCTRQTNSRFQSTQPFCKNEARTDPGEGQCVAKSTQKSIVSRCLLHGISLSTGGTVAGRKHLRRPCAEDVDAIRHRQSTSLLGQCFSVAQGGSNCAQNAEVTDLSGGALVGSPPTGSLVVHLTAFSICKCSERSWRWKHIGSVPMARLAECISLARSLQTYTSTERYKKTQVSISVRKCRQSSWGSTRFQPMHTIENPVWC